MRNALIFILLVVEIICGTQTVVAQKDELQNQNAVIEQRQKLAKMATKEIEKYICSVVKKEVKRMQKEGWKPLPGTLSLAIQEDELYRRRFESQGNFPRYILGQGSSKSKTLNQARQQAITNASMDLASNIGTEVVSLTETSESNAEYSAEEQQSLEKFVQNTQTMVRQYLGRTEVIFEAYRVVDGTTEVVVYVCCDGTKAKEAILNSIGEDSSKLRNKLENLMK